MTSRFALIFLGLLIFKTTALATPLQKSSELLHDGATARVVLTVSAAEITVADSLGLQVEVLAPAGYTVRMPAFADYGFAGGFNERTRRFRATAIGEIDKIPQPDGAVVYRQDLTLEPWLSGSYAILPLMFPFYAAAADDTGQPAFNIMTEGLRITVKPLPAERRQLAELFGQADFHPENLAKRQRRPEDKSAEELAREEEQRREAARVLKGRHFPWPVLAAVLLFGLLVPVLRYLGRRRIWPRLKAAAQLPPHDRAYQALAALQNKNLLQAGRIKEFYYELSYILRDYIGNRFNIRALNLTSEEFFHQLLKANPFDRNAERLLRDFSDHADTVKYSLYRPEPLIANESLAIARAFVDHTQPIKEEAA